MIDSGRIDDDPSGGTDTLLLFRTEQIQIEIGALGQRILESGAYADTGSAFGPGGFTQIDRHRRVAEGTTTARHWHVDYLLGDPGTELIDVVTSPGLDGECAVASGLGSGPIPGFGASDCDCVSHLASDDDLECLRIRIEDAHQRVRSHRR